MAPYTVEGLASRDQGPCVGESGGACESCPASPGATEVEAPRQPTWYTLRGVVVHRGQAGAGHYYSYILHHNKETGKSQWYKYDDTCVRRTCIASDVPTIPSVLYVRFAFFLRAFNLSERGNQC